MTHNKLMKAGSLNLCIYFDTCFGKKKNRSFDSFYFSKL